MYDPANQPEVVVLLQREIERVLDVPENASDSDAPRHRWQAPRWRIAAVAIGCAVLLLTVGAIVRQSARTPGTESALADVARKIELAPQPRPDQFIYTKSSTEQMSPTAAGIDLLGRPFDEFLSSRVSVTESWISSERKGRLVWQFDEPTYPTERDTEVGGRYWWAFDELRAMQSDPSRRDELRAMYRRMLRHERESGSQAVIFPAPTERETGVMMPNHGIFIGSEHVPAAKVAEYPRDPAEIYRRVRAGAERAAEDMNEIAKQHPDQAALVRTDPDLEVWRSLTNPTGVQEQPIPTDLRAAMLKALALLPGVKSVGERSDPKGRTGEAFEWNRGGVRETVIYDAETAVLLSATSILVDPSAHQIAAFHRVSPGMKIYQYELIEQRTLDALPEQ